MAIQANPGLKESESNPNYARAQPSADRARDGAGLRSIFSLSLEATMIATLWTWRCSMSGCAYQVSERDGK